jgi:hypothetical protein
VPIYVGACVIQTRNLLGVSPLLYQLHHAGLHGGYLLKKNQRLTILLIFGAENKKSTHGGYILQKTQKVRDHY